MKINYLIFIVILSMIVGGFFSTLLQKHFSTKPSNTVIVQEHTITHTDTVFISPPTIIDKTIPELTSLQDSMLRLYYELQSQKIPIRDTIFICDTINTYIVRDYFTKRTYDTLLVDTEHLQTSVKTEIGRNRLLNITLRYSVPQQVKIVQKRRYRSLDDFHIFSGVSIPTNGNVSIGVLVSPKKSRWLLGASYGLQGTVALQAHYLLW